MIDAPSWGQDWAGIMRDNAATVAASDPDKNVLFSVHMYGVYNNASTINAYLDAFKSKGLPLVIGEFGNMHSDGDPDEDTIMSESVKRGPRLLRLVLVGQRRRCRVPRHGDQLQPVVS